MIEYIRVKKKIVKKILVLYTMEGLTQKQIALIVFGKDDIKGVSTYAIVQRVLHYFGLNMQHRRNYKNEGLTEEIINLILDNRTIAFPLAIPTEGKFNSAINFDAEVNGYLNNSGLKWKMLFALKNIAVLSFMVVLTYLSINNNEVVRTTMTYAMMVGMIFIPSLFEGDRGKGVENSRKREMAGAILGILIMIAICILSGIFSK